MDLTKLEPSRIDPSLKGKNFLFYGDYGTRKTTVASFFPNAVFAQTEEGTKFIDGIRGVKIKNWNDMVMFVRQLKKPEVREMYDTVVFDMASKLYDYAEQYTVNGKLDGVEIDKVLWGKGYKALKNEYARVIDQIQALGYGLVFIAHDKVSKDDNDNDIRILDLEKNPSHILNAIVDFTFHVKKEDGTVMAYSNTDGISASKSRARYFPKSFEFTYDNLEKELAKAIEEQVKVEGIITEVKARVKEEKTRPYEEIKARVLSHASKMMQEQSPNFPLVQTTIISLFGNTAVSQADEKFYNQMATLETYLMLEHGLE